jgi:hypothetical protein
MNITPQEYAEMVINKFGQIRNIHHLARSISYVASKYAKWTIESIRRMDWATDGTDEHAKRNELAQKEAQVKCEAYRLALFALTDKLPK